MSWIWNNIILSPMVNILILIYHGLFQNFGLAIIGFTILIRLLTYPLTAQQLKSQKKIQELTTSKKYLEIQKKYKDDREKFAQEQMKLYQEMGVSPFSSCLPLLIQFPIMIGLYQAISLAMASAPIQMLTLSQSLYPIIPAAQIIPLNSTFLWLNLGLPETAMTAFRIGTFAIPIMTILVVVTTYLQSKLMTPATTTPGDQGAAMARSMNLTMPLLMGWISYSLSSGLALYFIVSNLLGIAQYAAMGQVHWSNLLPKKKVATPKKPAR